MEMIEEVILEFGLKFSCDIIASRIDDAAEVVICGRLSNVYRHLCYHHGIHLAIIDDLYKSSNPMQ